MSSSLPGAKALVVGALLVATAFLSWPALAGGGHPQARPDLVVSGVAMSPASGGDGDTVTFTATVTNQGDASAARFRVGFEVDGEPIGKGIQAGGLEAGASVEVKSPQWVAKSGTHHVHAEADAGDVVSERDEANNDFTTDVTVGGLAGADLLVEGLSWAPSAPADGDKVVLTATIANRGDVDAGGFEVAFRVDDHARGARHVESLAAGATVQVEAPPWPAEQGDHPVVVVADAGDKVPESHEDNNERTATVTVGPVGVPDLLVATLTVEPDSPQTDDQVVLRAKVTNRGAAVTGPFRVAFSVDGEVIGYAAVDSLAAGASIDVTSPAWQATSGDHTATAEADADGSIAEAREDNNDRSVDFRVTQQGGSVLGLSVFVGVCRDPPSPGRPIMVGNIAVDVQVGDHTGDGACSP